MCKKCKINSVQYLICDSSNKISFICLLNYKLYVFSSLKMYSRFSNRAFRNNNSKQKFHGEFVMYELLKVSFLLFKNSLKLRVFILF